MCRGLALEAVDVALDTHFLIESIKEFDASFASGNNLAKLHVASVHLRKARAAALSDYVRRPAIPPLGHASPNTHTSGRAMGRGANTHSLRHATPPSLGHPVPLPPGDAGR